jgi:hypothetical protein
LFFAFLFFAFYSVGGILCLRQGFILCFYFLKLVGPVYYISQWSGFFDRRVLAIFASRTLLGLGIDDEKVEKVS